MNRDLVFLLGAGFSADADLPVMSQFAAAAQTERFDITRYADATPPQRIMAPELKKAATIYEAFRELCRSTDTLLPEAADNIEKVMCVAEALRATSASPRELILNGTAYTIDQIIAAIELWVWKIYHQLPFFNTGKRSPKPQTYRTFFELITRFGLGPRTSVITTNYDIVFEWMAFEAGLKANYPIRYERLDVGTGTEQFISSAPSPDSIPTFKLHGSCNFFRVGQGPAKLYVSGNISDGRPIGLTRFRAGIPSVVALDAVAALRQQLRDERIQPVIVPPTYLKAASADWQKEVWTGAIAALQHCRALVVIGYSLPPTDGFMESALAASLLVRAERTKPQVFVINDDRAVHQRFRAIYGTGAVYDTLPCRLDVANSEVLPHIFQKVT